MDYRAKYLKYKEKLYYFLQYNTRKIEFDLYSLEKPSQPLIGQTIFD